MHTRTWLVTTTAFSAVLLAPALAVAQDGANTKDQTPPGENKSAPVVSLEDNEAAIRANAQKYVEAYNRRDSKTMASMWSPEAVYMDPETGEAVVGAEAIAELFDQAFAGSEDSKLSVNIASIEFVSPNVAIEKGTATVTYAEHPTEETEYSAVLVKRGDKWLIDRISETEIDAPPPSHYEQLRELEWMIGSWIDDDGSVMIQTDCQWTKNRNFLTRSFAVLSGDDVDMSGMQIVAWDPSANTIRSWVFDSDGTFGEGTWTWKDDRWVIQQAGTLPDGKKTAAVHIIKPIDNDSYTWQAINRTVDGEVLPNIEEVVIVRRPDMEQTVDVAAPPDQGETTSAP